MIERSLQRGNGRLRSRLNRVHSRRCAFSTDWRVEACHSCSKTDAYRQSGVLIRPLTRHFHLASSLSSQYKPSGRGFRVLPRNVGSCSPNCMGLYSSCMQQHPSQLTKPPVERIYSQHVDHRRSLPSGAQSWAGCGHTTAARERLTLVLTESNSRNREQKPHVQLL